MLSQVPADGPKPRRGWAHRLLTAALLWLAADSVTANCSRPDPRENMMLTGEALLKNEFPEGSAVTFQCSVGFKKDGGSGNTFCSGGQWTEVTLSCSKKSCGSPGEVQNGRFDISEGIEFGATAKAICNEGFYNVGQNYRQCLDQGWTGRIPKCEVVKCQDPPEVRNGMIAFKPSTEYPHYRDVVQYACSDGYTLVGEMSIMCNASGEYEPQAPECRDIICETPTVPNGRRVGGALPPYKLHNFVKYECNEGYKMDGRAQITCTVNGWSHSGPTCQPVKCDRPPEILNGKIVSRPSREYPQYQDIIEYACNKSYYNLIGESAIRCNSDGKYSAVPPTCEVKSCGSLGDVQHGKITHSKGTEVGSTATVTCDDGYKAVGNKNVTCLDEGWSKQLATCKGLCPIPDGPENVVLIKDHLKIEFLDGSTATFECITGYESSSGEPTISCTGRQWTVVTLKCQRIDRGIKYAWIAIPGVGGILLGFVLYKVYQRKTGDYRTREEDLKGMDDYL